MTEDKKMTVQDLSVGADKGQPLSNSSTDSIPDFDLDFNRDEEFLLNYLRTVSLTELYDTVFQPRAQLVEGMLNAGTYLFAGAPKVGKSFFMAQLAYHVSNGILLWDYPVHQGTVLYLALEDDCSRLQKRLSRMFGMESTDRLKFATSAHSLSEGLDGQLREFVRKNPDTKLIIIDILQKIREAEGEQYSYAKDYEIVTRLKAFSDQENICILLVHHTRKQSADDCFYTISGTNGLLGAADGAFIMHKERRTESRAVLDIVGRDQQDQRMQLSFDPEHCIWNLTQAETELWKEKPDPILIAISKMLTDESPCWTGTASELLDRLQETDLQPNVLTRRLNVSAGKLWNDYQIRYENKRTHTGRMITLTLAEK